MPDGAGAARGRRLEVTGAGQPPAHELLLNTGLLGLGCFVLGGPGRQSHIGTGPGSRLHIVGGPGSGKTTLARRLGHLLQVPVYDLDTIAYQGGAGPARDPARRRADAEAIARQPGWITEGIYLDAWCAPLAEGADRIVWLDVPWHVAVVRIARRHVLLSLAGTNRHPGLLKLARFVWATRRLYRTPSATAAWLAPYRHKLSHCRSGRDLAALLNEVAQHAPPGA